MINGATRSNKKSQRGYFLLGVSIALLAAAITTVGTSRLAMNTFKENIGKSLGNQVQTVVTGLNAYVSAHQSVLLAGAGAFSATVNGVTVTVANRLAPTVDELKRLGYLSSIVQLTPTSGSAYRTSIILTPASCHSTLTAACKVEQGVVFLQDPINGPDGRLADLRLLSAAMNASSGNQIGFSSPEAPTLVRGPGWQQTNPDASQRAGILFGTTALSGVTSSGQKFWLESVTNKASLPTSGNSVGDIRVDREFSRPYVWGNVLSGSAMSANGQTNWRELYDLGNSNIAVGPGAGGSGATYGSNNSYFGNSAGWENNTGSDNTFVGASAGFRNQHGYGNSYMGSSAGRSNRLGSRNTFVGGGSGFSVDGANDNTFVGFRSGASTYDASGNTFIGSYSGQAANSSFANLNVFVGSSSGSRITSGTGNVIVGANAALNSLYPHNSVIIGQSAGYGSNGQNNVFVGYNSGYSNTSGFQNVFSGFQSGFSNSTGNSNVFNGAGAGSSNTSGSSNVFIGSDAGRSNTVGFSNVFSGHGSGYSNTTGGTNVFSGVDSGRFNTSGTSNVFMGWQSGYLNTTGLYNVFIGRQAGLSNINGIDNLFVGRESGRENSTGRDNVFIGKQSGATNKTGYQNVFLGVDSFGASSDLFNATAVGYYAVATSSNSVRIGNNAVTLIGGAVAWSNLSDRRKKADIRDSDRGLDFINKLKPVDYTLTESKKAETGFIAQDVEAIDPTFPGVNKPASDKDFYSLAYTDFIPSMVKSIQQLDAKIEALPAASQSNEISQLKQITMALAAAFVGVLGLVGWLARQVFSLKRQVAVMRPAGA